MDLTLELMILRDLALSISSNCWKINVKWCDRGIKYWG